MATAEKVPMLAEGHRKLSEQVRHLKTIERPEQFKTLWDSLASASELVLDIERDGRPSRLRYVISP